MYLKKIAFKIKILAHLNESLAIKKKKNEKIFFSEMIIRKKMILLLYQPVRLFYS